jgi:hypothetical protein
MAEVKCEIPQQFWLARLICTLPVQRDAPDFMNYKQGCNCLCHRKTKVTSTGILFETYSWNRKHKAAKGHIVHSLVKEVTLFNAGRIIALKITDRLAITGRKTGTE